MRIATLDRNLSVRQSNAPVYVMAELKVPPMRPDDWQFTLKMLRNLWAIKGVYDKRYGPNHVIMRSTNNPVSIQSAEDILIRLVQMGCELTWY